MTDYQDNHPAYLTFRMTVPESPLAQFADQEAWRARDRYPQVMGLGLPEFFHMGECEQGGWEVLGYGNITPQGSRDSLGSHFRMHAKEAQDAGDEKNRRKWMAAAKRMDREVVNDLTVQGRRYRIVRVSRFLRMGPNGPEPPRPSDRDTGEVGGGDVPGPKDKGHIVDVFAWTGLSEGILKMELVDFVNARDHTTEEGYEDSRKARREYPGGVLMPPVFTVSERRDGQWGAFNIASSYATAQGARDALASYLRLHGPWELGLDEETKAEWAAHADRLDETRANALVVDGVRYRVTRVERLVRMGPDGPEPPRGSDYDPEEPSDVQVKRLKDAGLWKDEEDDTPPDPEISAQMEEYRALWEAERARKKAWRKARGMRDLDK
ncbi:DUF5954 family protein [Streptomyces acidiscabies]|uniref:DUF5954 family protein n=1 Tax=Streptomyces acidiscabies TaxID=42234 RepID=UPI0038F75427